MSNQKPRSIDDQLNILRKRGMEFKDEELAKSYLERVSYFRLRMKLSRELAKQAANTKCRGKINAEPSSVFIKNKSADFRA